MVVNVFRMLNPITHIEQEYMPIPQGTERRCNLDLDPEYAFLGKMPEITWYRATPYNIVELENNGISLRYTGRFLSR